MRNIHGYALPLWGALMTVVTFLSAEFPSLEYDNLQTIWMTCKLLGQFFPWTGRGVHLKRMAYFVDWKFIHLTAGQSQVDVKLGKTPETSIVSQSANLDVHW